MIVRVLESGRAVATLMTAHLATAAHLFRALDTRKIELSEPREPFAYVVGNHDAGWFPENERLELNAATGWPYHVFEHPDLVAGRIYVESVRANGRHHPYCGVLTSMHVQGFFNGRFGQSKPTPARGPGEAGMLEQIAALEREWRAGLAADPATAPWVEERRLFRAYRLLQLFDRLALYLNRGAPESGDPPPPALSIPGVPSVGGGDVELSIRWASRDRMIVHPYPFTPLDLDVAFASRMISKTSSDAELRAMVEASALFERRVTLGATADA